MSHWVTRFFMAFVFGGSLHNASGNCHFPVITVNVSGLDAKAESEMLAGFPMV